MDGNRPFPDTLYERDFAAWAAAQAQALRAGAYDSVDWENVIEEIETLGRSERSTLRSAIGLILEHRIKFDHGVNDAPKGGWKRTIKVQQRHARKTLTAICFYLESKAAGFAFEPLGERQRTCLNIKAKCFKESPSLKPLVGEMIAEEYGDARDSALDSFELYEEARLDHYRAAIPETCPYAEADVLG